MPYVFRARSITQPRTPVRPMYAHPGRTEIVGPATVAAYTETTFVDAATNPLTTGSVSWLAGDKIVVIGLTADAATSISSVTTTGTGVPLVQGPVSATPSAPWGSFWTAEAEADGSGTFTATRAGTATTFGIAVWVVRGAAGFGAQLTPDASTTKTVTLERVSDHSLVLAAVAEAGGGATSGYVWTPTVGTEREVATAATRYSVFVAEFTDQGPAAATAYGITGTASAANHTRVAVELLGSATAAAAPSVDSTAYTAAGIDFRAAAAGTTPAGGRAAVALAGSATVDESLTNTGDAGTPGAAVTTANTTTSGDGFTVASPTGDATLTYAAGGYRVLTAGAGGTATLRWVHDPQVRVHYRVCVELAAVAAQSVIRVRSGTTHQARIAVDAAGKLIVRNAAGTIVATSATTLTTGVRYRIETRVTRGTSGEVDLYLYPSGSATAELERVTVTADFGTGLIDDVTFGPYVAATNVDSVLDDLAYRNWTWVGPTGPPTVAATAYTALHPAARAAAARATPAAGHASAVLSGRVAGVKAATLPGRGSVALTARTAAARGATAAARAAAAVAARATAVRAATAAAGTVTAAGPRVTATAGHNPAGRTVLAVAARAAIAPPGSTARSVLLLSPRAATTATRPARAAGVTAVTGRVHTVRQAGGGSRVHVGAAPRAATKRLSTAAGRAAAAVNTRAAAARAAAAAAAGHAGIRPAAAAAVHTGHGGAAAYLMVVLRGGAGQQSTAYLVLAVTATAAVLRVGPAHLRGTPDPAAAVRAGPTRVVFTLAGWPEPSTVVQGGSVDTVGSVGR